MLVIRRRAGEAIRIGEDITLHVLEVSASRVKLGVAAPRDIAVTRVEVLDSADQNRQAAVAPGSERIDAVAALLRAGENPPKNAPPDR